MSLPALHIGELTARIPIIQGGMGIGISLSGLAGAVAKRRRYRCHFRGTARFR